MRFVLLPGLLATLPLAVSAQERTTWSELFASPDIGVQVLLQAGVGALRSQVDLKYSTLDVNLRGGRIDISDVQAWPILPHDPDGNCAIVADRLTIQTADFSQPELVRARIQATGVEVPLACLPPQARIVPQIARLTTIDLPRLTADLNFDIPSAEADIRVFTELANVASVSLDAEFAYLWARANATGPSAPGAAPEVVAYLRSASVGIENLGGWDLARDFLPPPLTDPAQAGQTIQGLLAQGLAGMSPNGALNAAQQDFVASAAEAWPAFLANPQQLVVETGFDPDEDILLAVDAYGSDPAQVFTDLQPQLRLASRAARQSLPLDVLSVALSDDPSDLSAEDRRRAGIALVTGNGAPRNVSAGAVLLSDLAENGDGRAAMALAEALADSDPPRAYFLALLAGEAGTIGAPSLLDRLERSLDIPKILAMQEEAHEYESAEDEDFSRMSVIRQSAIEHLSGNGRIRSYRLAALLASLGKAAGDVESSDILAQVDARMSRGSPDEKEVWADLSNEISIEAIEIWTREDLPARLSQR